MITRYDAKSPKTGNPLTLSYAFNLMLQKAIGPTSLLPGLLRPKTAHVILSARSDY